MEGFPHYEHDRAQAAEKVLITDFCCNDLFAKNTKFQLDSPMP
jgi:hypothetical protein